jgi:3-oxoacyl-[acyl-carrier-protein] synthase II
MALGSLGAFLVLEATDHARARGAPALAKLSRVLSERTRRRPGDITAALGRMWVSLASAFAPGHVAVLSGATGAEPATSEERAFLQMHPGVPVHASGTFIGHGMDAQFPMNVALAALALSHGRPYSPQGGPAAEAKLDGALKQAVVTGVGHWRGEGMALVEAVQ